MLALLFGGLVSDWNEVAAGIVAAGMRSFAGSSQATYAPSAGGSFLVDVIFSSEREVQTVGDAGIPISTMQPVAAVDLSQFAALPKKRDAITISGVTYEVLEFQPDRHGAGGELILKLED